MRPLWRQKLEICSHQFQLIRTSQGWTRVILAFEFHFIHVFLAGLLLPPEMRCQKSSDIAIYIDLYFADAEFWIGKISDLVRACMSFEQHPWPSNLFRHVWRSTLGVHDNKNGASVASHRWVPLGRGLSSFVVAALNATYQTKKKELASIIFTFYMLLENQYLLQQKCLHLIENR
jgi:hypothetical protein